MGSASIFFFVSPFATPIKDCDTALFPVTHGVPVACLIGPQSLIGAEAGVTPKFSDLVEAGINSGGDALPFRIARTKEQDVAARFDIANQGSDPLYRIGWNEGLFGKNVLELFVILVRESEVVRLLDLETTLLRFANAAAASAFHTVEQILFRAGQVGTVGRVIFGLESWDLAVFQGEIRIRHFEMQAFEIVPGKRLERF